MDSQKAKHYWIENFKLILKLLVIWLIISFLCCIVFIEQLNQIEISGIKLGYWFEQQGLIYTFVILIFVYIKQMVNIDKKYGIQL